MNTKMLFIIGLREKKKMNQSARIRQRGGGRSTEAYLSTDPAGMGLERIVPLFL